MYFWQNFLTLNQTNNFTSNYKWILFLCKIFKYVFSTFHNRISLPLYSEKYARKWRGAIFIGRRWTDKIRSLSVRRKFQFVFDGRDAEESSYRYYWNAPCSSLFLSRQPNEAANEVGGEKEVFEESLPSKLSHLSEFLGKSIQSPRGENAAKRRRERPPPSEASKRAGARASSFSISAPLCPFHRGPSSAKRLADCSYCPRRNGLLGFPSGFLHPVSPSVFPT